ncbi:precorrin-3B C17-methyltransferase [Methanophagales archaeon]|nr:precorrin-3B C17-methyltransferase [Methanophagales archaeon]
MGNERYIELIKEIIPSNAELIIGKMGTEVERAKKAVELGNRKNVVIVSGGDPGIYGMAGLTLEVIGDSEIGVEIVPGITAASAAAALLGAPLSNDFAVVSLSDLLVPWPEIEKRLEGLAMMGIAVAIYNPKSKTRTTQLERAHEIFMRVRDGKTIVGLVKNAERVGYYSEITTLSDLPDLYHQIDMSTTIVIGCSGTKNIGGRMVTRRGYERKYDYDLGDTDSLERGDLVASGARVWEQSKAIVAEIVSQYPLSEHERRVAGRVVFANADPSFMDLIVFEHNPIEKGIHCIQDGKTIITDIEMVKAGISKRYKENVKCFVNNPKTREIAVKEDITRTAAGFRIAKELIRDNIVVIGNAPSTCLELSALIKEGIKPALIIATPVGFVNAADVKEDVLSTGIPCIVIRGPRGGTPSAVAIINAIIELGMEEERGGN